MMNEAMLEIKEEPLNEEIIDILIHLSQEWEREDNVYGYRSNDVSDIAGNRVFIAYINNEIAGYAFGNGYQSKNMKSIMPEGTACFEMEELYVREEYRSMGIGKRLFETVCETVKEKYDFITLVTATKNYRAILHFYIEEVGMDFWSARLFKKL